MVERYTHVGRRVWDKEKQKYVMTCLDKDAAQRAAKVLNSEPEREEKK